MNYLEEQDLVAHILAHRADPEDREAAERLWLDFHLLASHAARRVYPPRSRDYEDAVQSITLTLYQRRHKWRTDGGKAFCYFTSICYTHCLLMIRSNKLHEQICSGWRYDRRRASRLNP